MSTRFTTHQRGLRDAPCWLSLWVPLLVYPIIIGSIFVYLDFYGMMMRKEGGIEWLAVGFLLVGAVYGVMSLVRYRKHLPAKWLVGWFVLSVVGMFVFAGEEVSWGQHTGLWTHEDIPELFKARNDQQETNLHNMSNALDQGPTNLIVLGTFAAFVLNPLFLRWRRETMKHDNPGYWFWPTRAGLTAAVGVVLIPWPKRIYEWVDGKDDSLWRHSELHEFYIALLMTVYIVSVYCRLAALDKIQGQPLPVE